MRLHRIITKKGTREMNATELADELENTYPFVGVMEIAATMLRQQQEEIEALKMDIHSLTYGERLTKYFNKPVAYIDPYDLERLPHYDCHIGSQQLKNGIPLYTHPVKQTYRELHEGFSTVIEATHPVKEQLTNREIMEICIGFGMYDCINDPYIKKDGTYSLDEDLIRFARAILRKAQEK